MLQSTKSNLIINNAVELGDNISVEDKGKGRHFTSRFIEAGLAHYQEFGDVLITKETLDKFIYSMVGCPVIIRHKDITAKNVDKERVGVVSKVWYNELDGWFWCEGIIWDKQAIDLIKNQGWSVSCTYDFESDFKKGTYHGKDYDMEFTGGEFLHLALVDNPRYERANIVVNSKDEINNEDNFITVGEGENKHPVNLNFLSEINEILKRNHILIEEDTLKHDKKYKIEGCIDGIDIEKKKHNLEKIFGENNVKIESLDNIDQTRFYLKVDTEDFFNEQNRKRKEKSNKKEKNNDEDEIKQLRLFNNKGDIIMSVLNELKEFIQNVVNNKGEDMVVENEKVDKRDVIRQIMAIAGKEEASEDVKTIAKLAEKLAYDSSEDSKADNKAKNEEDEEKEEKFEEEKEIANKKAKNEEEKEEAENKCKNEEEEVEEKEEEKAENKCKNSMDETREIVYGGSKVENMSYIPISKRIELGNNY